MQKNIHIKEIGNVSIVKKKGVRRMTLSVRPFRPIRLTIPHSVTYSQAVQFMYEKKEWIIKSRAKISKTENNQTLFDFNSNFQTRERRLLFEASQNGQDKIKITKDSIIVQYADKKTIGEKDMQSFIRKGITEALRIEAKQFLPIRCALLARKFNFLFNEVSVRNAKTRWGSCSGKNNISLNIQLMRLPDFLIDYVILHELCHTVEKNHGKQFWSLLDKVTGDAKKLDNELKKYSPEYF
jgi:predicted metal-dependent hydrolase